MYKDRVGWGCSVNFILKWYKIYGKQLISLYSTCLQLHYKRLLLESISMTSKCLICTVQKLILSQEMGEQIPFYSMQLYKNYKREY